MTSLSLPASAFTVRRDIRFSDSDPAGIVFYAAFFRMFNDVFEDWVTQCLGIDFARQFRDEERMFPLVHVEVDFKEARRMGQKMDFTLVLTGLGRSSIRYDIVGHDDGMEILRGSFVTVTASKRSMATIAIPDDIRTPMERYLAACEAG